MRDVFRSTHAVFEICRQIRRETIPIFYGGNTFPCEMIGGSIHAKNDLLAVLAEDVVAYLNRIEISAYYYCKHRSGPSNLPVSFASQQKAACVTAVIDRSEGTVCRTEIPTWLRCPVGPVSNNCERIAEEYAGRLIQAIHSLGMLDKSHSLKKDDVDRVAKQIEKGREISSTLYTIIGLARGMTGRSKQP